MLRKLQLNRRQIPIPVPIQNVGDLLTWLSQSLVKGDEEITKILVDGEDLTHSDPAQIRNKRLSTQSKVEVMVDTPMDLAVQSLDAIRNLSMVIARGLKSHVVEAYQTPPTRIPADVDAISSDLVLIRELSQHVTSLTNQDFRYTVIGYIVEKLTETREKLDLAARARDWQKYASLMLNELDPRLEEIGTEAESLQSQLYAQISQINVDRLKNVAG